MRGFLPILVCLALCLYYVSAVWSNEALKGPSCIAKCSNGKCNRNTEFRNCRCVPEKPLDAIKDNLGLPADGKLICLYIRYVLKRFPPRKCCVEYRKFHAYRESHGILQRQSPALVRILCKKIRQRPRLSHTQELVCKLQDLRDAATN